MKPQRTHTRGPVALMVGSILVWSALLIWMILIGALAGVWKAGAKLASLVSVTRTEERHRPVKHADTRGVWLPVKL